MCSLESTQYSRPLIRSGGGGGHKEERERGRERERAMEGENSRMEEGTTNQPW
jgi:hypothetical protein